MFDLAIKNTTNNTGYAVGDNGTILKYTSSLSINEFSKDIKVTVSPNPVNDYINIKIEAQDLNGLKLDIYDSTGKIIIDSMDFSNHLTALNIGNLKSGIYFLKIKSRDKTVGVKKIIIN